MAQLTALRTGLHNNMSNFETLKQHYMRFPDKSDFVLSHTDDGDPIFFYSDDEGFKKAQLLCFKTGIQAHFEQVDKRKVLELLESHGGDMDDISSDANEDELSDDEANILTSSYDDAPVIKLVNQIIIHAVKSGASDIHFEGREGAFLIRMRVDGSLNTIKTYPKNVQEPVLARIKVVGMLDVAESRRSQDGRINLKIGNRTIDIRVSTMPSVNGEKAVLRILERSSEFVSLQQIGLDGELYEKFRPYLDRPNGIILVTGPTGSGKTTTLYASLLAMNRTNKNVVTIEDPVEYHIDNVTQVQMNPSVGLTFANAIKTFLRQDPDIILVGEVRDNETAESAVQASLTGHLVLSTLHTNDSPTAIARLIEMDVEPFLISSSLLIVVGQRLVRKVCPHCATSIPTDDFIKDIFKTAGITLNSHTKGMGCEHCFNTGYRGRIGVFEMLEITDSIRHLINKRSSAFEIRAEARKQGFKTMLEYGAELVLKGVTTPEEVLSVTRVE